MSRGCPRRSTARRVALPGENESRAAPNPEASGPACLCYPGSALYVVFVKPHEHASRCRTAKAQLRLEVGEQHDVIELP